MEILIKNFHEEGSGAVAGPFRPGPALLGHFIIYKNNKNEEKGKSGRGKGKMKKIK